jgi:PleD family two-component response regulator
MSTSATTTSTSDIGQRRPEPFRALRTTPQRTIRILVVDDHPAVRWGLVQLLDDQPDMTVVAVAGTAEAALARAASEDVDPARPGVRFCGGHGRF